MFSVGDRVQYIERYRVMGPPFDSVGEVVEAEVNERGIEILLVEWEDRFDVPQVATGTHVEKV